MNRRALLKLAPAALAATGAPAAALCIADPAETPIIAMHREITRLNAVASDRNVPEAEADAACDRMMELADKIVDLPARDARDLLHKIMGHTCNGDHELGDCPRGRQIWAEARALVA